ncbi:hypothetical protein [Thalassotalea eurytherma]|uniref:Pyrrolidone-carboxylate peptidase n=1 Tax=Thalassotalea eurytherma TaxID=1144278 RepID=A0ABQ6H2K4_9GAMM|nr:hypothetical protein [Thalassotalea eurytherma]GLX81106.1 hypothetical protein theurythT_05580 [Thalassotalea eurytherma]
MHTDLLLFEPITPVKMLTKYSKAVVAVCCLLATASYANHTKPSVEELRINKAQQAMPSVVNRLSQRVNSFDDQVNKARSYTTLMQLVLRHSSLLWQDAVVGFKQANDQDDRALYWARLQMSASLRGAKTFKTLLPDQQVKLLWQFELLSRGQSDVDFNRNTSKRILITGFDPFSLDQHIDQSNPSGAAALALDDIVISASGESVEIETLIVPVRFADFDQGMIETLLTPYFAKQSVDMVITVSMGREDFDLEHFPGLRRSTKTPDNLNVYTGADVENPLVPRLNGQPLKGPEFVRFSLPYQAMKKATGQYKVNDNHFVQTLDKGKIYPERLSQLRGETSVQGSGGGYLSNEISYRSILLRNDFAPVMPVGHIHTPKIKAFEPEKTQDIIEQIKQMIGFAITEI